MKNKIILYPAPLSINGTYRSVCRGNFPCVYMTPRGKDLKESYQLQARCQFKQTIEEGELELHIKLFFSDKRKHDIDNYGKVLFDSLTGIIWKDDSQIQKMTVEKFYDKSNSRVEICILQFDSKD